MSCKNTDVTRIPTLFIMYVKGKRDAMSSYLPRTPFLKTAVVVFYQMMIIGLGVILAAVIKSFLGGKLLTKLRLILMPGRFGKDLMKEGDTLQDILTGIGAAAEFLGLNRGTLRRIMKERRIPFRYVGSGTKAKALFSRQALLNWLAEGEPMPKPKRIRGIDPKTFLEVKAGR